MNFQFLLSLLNSDIYLVKQLKTKTNKMNQTKITKQYETTKLYIIENSGKRKNKKGKDDRPHPQKYPKYKYPRLIVIDLSCIESNPSSNPYT